MESHGFTSSDKVNETLDDIQEMLDVSNEISAAFDQLSPTTTVADAELEDELNTLMAESLPARLPVPEMSLPSVPSEPLEEMDEITARLTRLRQRVQPTQ
ncbi:unnamed protein product [Soboliphyme baturini]|uniref:Charged multivesicular body protein 7 n=1 Tax=Soboliphyme baturini TaxID=241478 RepID=A0A183IAD6_9BILA|nr:unnamed protein product [Soboliphyme baturini]